MARSTGKYAQTVRALRLLARLRGLATGVRLRDLLDELKGSQSQLMRDLEALDEAGYRIKIVAEEDAPYYRRAILVGEEVSDATSTRREP